MKLHELSKELSHSLAAQKEKILKAYGGKDLISLNVREMTLAEMEIIEKDTRGTRLQSLDCIRIPDGILVFWPPEVETTKNCCTDQYKFRMGIRWRVLKCSKRKGAMV